MSSVKSPRLCLGLSYKLVNFARIQSLLVGEFSMKSIIFNIKASFKSALRTLKFLPSASCCIRDPVLGRLKSVFLLL